MTWKEHHNGWEHMNHGELSSSVRVGAANWSYNDFAAVSNKRSTVLVARAIGHPEAEVTSVTVGYDLGEGYARRFKIRTYWSEMGKRPRIDTATDFETALEIYRRRGSSILGILEVKHEIVTSAGKGANAVLDGAL